MGICRVIVYVEARTSEKESATGVSRTSRSKLVPSSTFGYKPQLLSNDLPGVAVPTSPFDGISHVTYARAPPPSLDMISKS